MWWPGICIQITIARLKPSLIARPPTARLIRERERPGGCPFRTIFKTSTPKRATWTSTQATRMNSKTTGSQCVRQKLFSSLNQWPTIKIRPIQTRSLKFKYRWVIESNDWKLWQCNFYLKFFFWLNYNNKKFLRLFD